MPLSGFRVYRVWVWGGPQVESHTHRLPEAGEAAGVAPPAQRALEPRRRSGGRMPLAWLRTFPDSQRV